MDFLFGQYGERENPARARASKVAAIARIMLEVVTVGIVVLWPMVRLSQEAPKRPVRALLLDSSVILVPAQAVLNQWLMSFKDYPPRQKPASFNLDEVMRKLTPQQE